MKMNTTELIKNMTDLPDYTPQRIKSLMQKLDLTEKGLAIVLNVLPMTVKLWTNGVSAPCTVARRMLFLIENTPQVIELIAKGAVENE